MNIIQTLKPLIIECQFFLIWTPFSKSMLFTSYSVVIQFLLISSFPFSVYGKQSPLFDSYLSTVKIIDQIANLFLTLTTASTTLLTIFIYPKKIDKLIKDFNEFDRMTVKNCSKRRKLFWISFVMVQLLAFLTISVDTWVWISNTGYQMYKYYIVRNIQYYQVNLTILLIFWITMEIYYRFKILNEMIIEVTNELHYEKLYFYANNFTGTNKRITYKDLKYIAKLQNFLFNILDGFNGMYGPIILFLVFFFIFYITQYTTELIFYGVTENQINGASLGTSLSVISVIWIMECFILLIALAVAGSYLSIEGNKTVTICYNIINNMGVSYKQDLIKEEIKLIAQQTIHRNPKLRALGFFTVNFTIMGFIATSVTSYIIVAIQFRT